MGKLSISEFIKTDFIEFVKNIWNLQDTPENWNYVIYMADEIAEKYAHSRFVEKMLLAAMDYLEEKQKNMGKMGNGQKQD